MKSIKFSLKKILILFTVFLCTKTQSQSIYLELLGKGVVNSINYEHHLSKRISGFNAQLGIGFAPSSLVTIPASINYVFGKRNHHLELGAGLTYINGYLWVDDDRLGPEVGVHLNLLYRYQKPEGRYFYKAGFTPFVARGIGTWFGVGVGYSFRSI